MWRRVQYWGERPWTGLGVGVGCNLGGNRSGRLWGCWRRNCLTLFQLWSVGVGSVDEGGVKVPDLSEAFELEGVETVLLRRCEGDRL